ncbi:MAG: hypothetical protein LBT65_03365, partial [Synergistaceae bacterium]|nr:hypothetical protein [Synergistaceae bacterium]
MADMAISGIASGIDWNSMVEQMLEKARKPAYIVAEKRDNLERKRSYWEEFQVSLQALQSALSPLKLASNFRAKMVEFERIDSNASYKSVLTAVVNSDAEINVYDVYVDWIAKSQVNRSNQFTSTTVGSLWGTGVTSSYFYINAGSKKIRIDVNSSDSLQNIADRINTQLKTQSPPIGVTASVVDSRLILKSDNTGLGTTTQEITVTHSGPIDALDSNLDLSGASVVITQNGTTYTLGKDFDIVGGNKVRWRQTDPLVPPARAVYQDTYTAVSGDTYTMTATRGTGDTDAGVLPFTPKSDGSITIKSHGGTVTYTKGTDFAVNTDGSVDWLGAKRPPAGVEYDITYTSVSGGET